MNDVKKIKNRKIINKNNNESIYIYYYYEIID